MSGPLGPSAARYQDRLQDMLIILDDMLREHHHISTSPVTVAILNDMLDLARRAFAREPDMPPFMPLPENTKLTNFDLELFTRWLAGICYGHEERKSAPAARVPESSIENVVETMTREDPALDLSALEAIVYGPDHLDRTEDDDA